MIDWEEILEVHGPLVWRTVRRMTPTHADACDCYQETFLSALRVARRQPVKSWGALLRHLASARAIDCLRRRPLGLKHAEAVAETEARSPDRRAAAAEALERLQQALPGLPPQQAEAFWLRCVEQASYEEVAESLGVGIENSRVLVHRARQQLRRLLSPVETRERERSDGDAKQ